MPENPVDSDESVQLDAEQSHSDSLEWTATEEGEWTIEVRSDDDTDEGSATVEEAVAESVAVETNPADGITHEEATLHGDLTEMDALEDCDVWFEWGEDGQDLPNSTPTQTLSEPQAFDETITGLSADQDHEFRAHADGDEESDEGATLMFTTDPEPITIAGDVLDTDGNPQEGARIVVVDQDANERVADLESDSAGEFSVDVPYGPAYHASCHYYDEGENQHYTALSYPNLTDDST